MEHITLTELNSTFVCPRCKYENPTFIEHRADCPDRIKCIQCAVYFDRTSYSSSRFESADGKHVFLDESGVAI